MVTHGEEYRTNVRPKLVDKLFRKLLMLFLFISGLISPTIRLI